ncbi:MAG TPA: inositol monophosphatase family protein [Anaerolineales bacterium]
MDSAFRAVAPEELQARLIFAVRAAYQAGEILRQGYGTSLQVGRKGEVDLVTEYDLQSEKALVELVQREFPGETILAEEGSPTSPPSSSGDQARWLIDPLDGTTNFAHGLPFFSVSIAWARDGEPLVGVVYDPLRHELFHAVRGGGAWLGPPKAAGDPPAQKPRRLHVSEETKLGDSLLVTGFPYDIRTNPENNLNHYAAFALRSRAVRRLGSAALDLSYLASGRFDGYWELRLSPWDWAAGVLLVREAGGTVTRADGGPDLWNRPTSLLATNGRIHEAMLEVLLTSRGVEESKE